MVRLTRIYTRTGDRGQTRLADGSVTDKTDSRVEAYGDVDEANSAIGVALASGQLSDEVAAVLRSVQNELFDLGADLANPLASAPAREPLRVTQDYVDRLEDACDRFSAALPDLTSFVLPGGSMAAAQLHVARTVVRRAERAGWAAVHAHGVEPAAATGAGGVSMLALTYLNRLSDLLFILSRVANPGTEVLWVPGGDRPPVASPDIDADRETPA